MSPSPLAPPTSVAAWARDWTRWVPGLAVVAVLVLRLPFLTAPMGSDEGGYLAVAAQWHGAGSSLYGRYWVDRPPGLLMIFQLAAALGGLPALRVIGATGAAIAVVGVALAGRQISGPRPAAVAAVVAAALFVSPLMGTVEVNGELLAAPFVALGIAVAVRAVSAPGGGRGWALGVGACAMAAILVKQNMLEVGVFALVYWLLARRSRRVDGRGLLRLTVSAAVGAVLVLLLVGGWTLVRGTSPAGVFYAMYPFRIQAAPVILAHRGPHDAERLGLLVQHWWLSAVPVAGLAFAALVLARRLRGAACWALLVVLCFATASVFAGGGNWMHYLVETVVPTALATGALVTVLPRPTWALAGAMTTVSLLAGALSLAQPVHAPGSTIGAYLARVARPGDTVASVFGSAETVRRSGMLSPYPYLWTLPAQTLDPHLRLLRRTLSGSRAPSWVVAWGRRSFDRADTRRLDAVIRHRYLQVARICGQRVYLYDGLVRPRAPLPIRCSVSSALQAPLRRIGRGL